MKIILDATREKVTLYGVEYRLYRGATQTGIEVEMLGLFRISDPEKCAQFEREVCSVGVDDPPKVTLLSDRGLVSP